MILTGYRLGILHAPLRTPFRTALRSVDAVADIVLALDTDTGHVGWGSAPATAVITGDTHASILEALRTYLLPPLIGQPVADWPQLCADNRKRMAHNTNAKAAVEIALLDLWAQGLGQPLCTALGSGPTTLRTSLTISLDAIDTMCAEVDAALARGFTALKIKLGRDGAEDLERVRRIHARCAGRATLRLDANQAWTAEGTVQLLGQLERDGILPELIEQPVPADDIAGLRFIRAHVATKVMADESVFDLPQLRRLIELEAADLVNVKLMKSGGITTALALADLCAESGLACQIGCMLESAIGATAAAHVAAARPAAFPFVDLDAPALCRHPGVLTGTRFDDARIILSAAPGLGITPPESITWLS